MNLDKFEVMSLGAPVSDKGLQLRNEIKVTGIWNMEIGRTH